MKLGVLSHGLVRLSRPAAWLMLATGPIGGGEVSTTVPEEHREVLDAPYAVLTTP